MTHLSFHRRATLAVGAALVALISALLLSFSASPATAVDETKPSPTCTGTLYTDPAGDAVDDKSGLGEPFTTTAGDYADITALFFKTTATETTANIQVKNLAPTVPSGAGQTVYYSMFQADTDPELEEFVKAEVATSGAVTFAFGSIDGVGNYTTTGPTTGKFFPGPDGIVQIVVPPAYAKAGMDLTAIRSSIDFIRGANDGAGLNTPADQAPDDADARIQKHTVTACPGGSTTPPPPPASGGGTVGGGPTGGGGGSTTTPPPSTMPLNIGISLGKAKAAKKGKTLKLKVNSTKPISNLKVTLLPSSGKGKALATGSLKSVNGAGTVKLKLKKKLKKGKYAVRATGVVDGKTLTVTKQAGLK